MPCWEVRTTSVEFKAEHADLLEKALDALEWSFNANYDRGEVFVQDMTINLKTGRATIRPDQQGKLNELKRAYSMQAIKRAATLNRWTVSKTKANKGSFVRTYQ